MKGSAYLILIVLAIMLSACEKECTDEAKICPDGIAVERNPKSNCEFDPCPSEGNVGAECAQDKDCSLPRSFAVRSVCPFSAHCYEGNCIVACLMAEHSPNPEVSRSYNLNCEDSSACDCSSYAADDMISCSCINGYCGAVVAE